MSQGIIDIIKVEIDSKSRQEDLVALFESIILKGRNSCAQLLQNVRKKRSLIFQRAEKKGYISGYTLGCKDGRKAFQQSSRNVRLFRKHIENQIQAIGFQVIEEIFVSNPKIQEQIIRTLLNKVRLRIKHISFVQLSTKDRFSSSIITNELGANYKIPISRDPELPSGMVRITTPVGELVLNTNIEIKGAVQKIIERLAGK